MRYRSRLPRTLRPTGDRVLHRTKRDTRGSRLAAHDAPATLQDILARRQRSAAGTSKSALSRDPSGDGSAGPADQVGAATDRRRAPRQFREGRRLGSAAAGIHPR
jgi:hypothetical protein